MRRLPQIAITALLGLLLSALSANAMESGIPYDSGRAVSYERTADGGVNLAYTLHGDKEDRYHIGILISTNGGKKFMPYTGTIWGDVGDSVAPGAKTGRIDPGEPFPDGDPSKVLLMFYPKPQRLAGPLSGMLFVTIQDGEFTMGSALGGPNERPPHKVKVERFRIMHTEVTQAQWKELMGTNPSWNQGDSLPVESVSWMEATIFAERLTNSTPGRRFRLPSEAEWEYACRAGTETAYYSGDDEQALSRIAWHRTNSSQSTQPVGSKEPNGWGLYDMSGNVWEWCLDVYHENYNGAPTDGSAWVEPISDTRVQRGGGYIDDRHSCRSSYRGRFVVTGKKNHHGFRLVEDLSLHEPAVYRKMR